ncbi:TlpA family protein disulfide reductase [Rubrivirga sp.]|uniref:TlpA family protein disulfide reductase n=1 Tax=Rubrivirga sp. TaxID=1885344 RepID=UPI003B52BFDB
MRPLLLLTLLAVAGCTSDTADADASADAAPGADLPLVEVASAEALVDDLDGLDADLVVLNFWATWCVPCRQEFPEFVRYGQEMEGEGVHVRFVSLDQPTDLPLVRAFLAEHDVSDPSYLYTGQGDVTSQLNPFVGGALPITMVLDGDGIVQDTHVGVMSYDELVATVDAARTGSTSS